MKALVFSAHKFERPFFDKLNGAAGHELHFVEERLTARNAASAHGFPAICAFAQDCLDRPVLSILRNGGTRFVALRSAGFNHVDLAAASELGIRAARVPAYSPYAVAEHAVALILALDRKLYRAVTRVRELNFSLDGLVGFDLHGRTVGVIGAGRIGSAFARIMTGFGCKVLVHDLTEGNALKTLGARYTSLDELFRLSDVISLHVPLTASSRHLVDAAAIEKMKTGVLLVNTGRGALIDTKALIDALKSGKVGAAGLDVYEEEENIFSRDLSSSVLQDDVLARLMTFPNVMITAHQAFLTEEALRGIVETTLLNLTELEAGGSVQNEVKLSKEMGKLT